ncbi:MAG: hypothetical protein E7651_01005 [Ruminococcaceae bacterium]|nr:hypothetical protein [Oscillospiraceae bacterium]MBQ8323991.1 hypothetical protein [Clostridia bacterium]
MVSQSLQAAAEAMGFTYAEKQSAKQSHMFGVYGGYLITLYDNGNQKTVFINYYMAPSEEEDDSVRLLELSEGFKSATAGYSVADYHVDVDGLSCTVACDAEEVAPLVDKLVELCGEWELAGVTQCSCCGNKIGKRLPKKLTKGKINFLLCEHCALEKMEEASKAPENNGGALPKKTGLGLLGALAGGILGILAYFLIYYFVSPIFDDSAFEMSYVFSLLGFGTAYLVYRGFTLFSKQPCNSAYAVVASVSLVCAALGQYIGTFAEFAKLQGFGLGKAMSIPAMWLIHLRSTASDAAFDYSATFYKLLCFSLLFALIGTIIFLLGLKDKAKVKKETVELETLRI